MTGKTSLIGVQNSTLRLLRMVYIPVTMQVTQGTKLRTI